MNELPTMEEFETTLSTLRLSAWADGDSGKDSSETERSAGQLQSMAQRWYDAAMANAGDAAKADEEAAIVIEQFTSAVELALFHLRRRDHTAPPDGERCTRAMILALEDALTLSTELSRVAAKENTNE